MSEAGLSWRDDFALDAAEQVSLRGLLDAGFPGWSHHQTRSYLKQIPTRRLLATHDEVLVGHLGLEHRAVGLADGAAQIFGVVDLCVAESLRGAGLGRRMVETVAARGREHGIDFVLLFADDPRLYEACGFNYRPTTVRWLKIHEHRSLGIAEEVVDELMVLPLGARRWPDGTLDLLGHLF